MTTPRYQTLRADQIPIGRSDDGHVQVRVIAGASLDASARIDTRVPIQMLHFTIAPGGALVQPVPREQNALLYVFRGAARIGSDERESATGQAALLASGDSVAIAVDAQATQSAEILLLAGKPLHEPVARYGPFVMNTPEQIEEAIRDYQGGRFGIIPQRSG
jgi:redox-sensitive bicupin YhaK (pirin superfamily)